MDRAWGVRQLRQFVTLVDSYNSHQRASYGWEENDEAKLLQMQPAVEIILRAAAPELAEPDETVHRWYDLRERTLKGIGHLTLGAEAADRMRPDSPQLIAERLHEWVWDAASSLWRSGHYSEAVRASATNINAQTQSKLERRDISETSLFQQAFSMEAPQRGQARLRIRSDDGSPTYRSLQRGAMAFAEGCFAALRNPASHEIQAEIPEAIALEQLAALNVLARWIEAAEVVR